MPAVRGCITFSILSPAQPGQPSPSRQARPESRYAALRHRCQPAFDKHRCCAKARAPQASRNSISSGAGRARRRWISSATQICSLQQHAPLIRSGQQLGAHYDRWRRCSSRVTKTVRGGRGTGVWVGGDGGGGGWWVMLVLVLVARPPSLADA